MKKPSARKGNIAKMLKDVKTVDDAFNALGKAVIIEACDEYRLALMTGDKLGICRCERFLKSDLFTLYSGGMDAEWIINAIRRECGQKTIRIEDAGKIRNGL